MLFTDDYVIAGILPELARDLAVSEGLAGQLITVFSATVAIAAPLCAILLAGLGRKPLILAALLLFACANLLAAFASSFGLLMAMRVAAALCAAATTPSLFAVAASMAPEGKAGRYIAAISLGVTGSIAFGVPLGTWIGAAFGWRWTFGCMAIGGLLAAIAIGRLLPRSERQPASDLKALLVPLMSRPLLLGFLANFLNMAASMMLLTYLAPVLLALGDIGPQQRGLVFGLSGFAGMAGVWLGGRAIDRRDDGLCHRHDRADDLLGLAARPAARPAYGSRPVGGIGVLERAGHRGKDHGPCRWGRAAGDGAEHQLHLSRRGSRRHPWRHCPRSGQRRVPRAGFSDACHPGRGRAAHVPRKLAARSPLPSGRPLVHPRVGRTVDRVCLPIPTSPFEIAR